LVIRLVIGEVIGESSRSKYRKRRMDIHPHLSAIACAG
jgi:hypothetical protein